MDLTRRPTIGSSSLRHTHDSGHDGGSSTVKLAMTPITPATRSRQWQSRLAMSRQLFSRGICSHVSSKHNTRWIESGLDEHCSRSEKKSPAKVAAGSSARAKRSTDGGRQQMDNLFPWRCNKYLYISTLKLTPFLKEKR